MLVRRTDLEQLKGEAMMLKEFLPRLLRKEVLTALPRLTRTEQGIREQDVNVYLSNILNWPTHEFSELAVVRQEKECLQSERDHLLRKTESLLADYEQEKKVGWSTWCMCVHSQPTCTCSCSAVFPQEKFSIMVIEQYILQMLDNPVHKTTLFLKPPPLSLFPTPLPFLLLFFLLYAVLLDRG